MRKKDEKFFGGGKSQNKIRTSHGAAGGGRMSDLSSHSVPRQRQNLTKLDEAYEQFISQQDEGGKDTKDENAQKSLDLLKGFEPAVEEKPRYDLLVIRCYLKLHDLTKSKELLDHMTTNRTIPKQKIALLKQRDLCWADYYTLRGDYNKALSYSKKHIDQLTSKQAMNHLHALKRAGKADESHQYAQGILQELKEAHAEYNTEKELNRTAVTPKESNPIDEEARNRIHREATEFIGRHHHQEGDTQRALKILQHIPSSQQNTHTLRSFAYIHATKAQYERALQYFQKMTSHTDIDHHITGYCFFQLERYQEALEKFDLIDASKQPRVLLSKARCYEKIGELDKAKALYDHENIKSDTLTLQALKYFTKRTGQLREYEITLKRLEARLIAQVNIEETSLLASTYADMGQFDKGIALFKQVPQYNEDKTILMALCTFLKKRGRFREAIAELEASPLHASHDTDILLNLGMLLKSRKEFERAIQAFNAIVNPDENVLLLLGGCYEASRNFQTAITICKTLKPTTRVLLFLARCYEKTEKYNLARETYQQIPLYDSDPQTLSSIAICFRKQEKYDEAIQMHKRSIDIEEASSLERLNAYLGYAKTLSIMGSYEEAIEQYKAIDNWIYNEDVLLALAKCYQQMKNNAEAENLYLSLPTLSEEPKLLVRFAIFYQETAQFEKAEEKYQQALELKPDDQETQLAFATYYFETQHYQVAITYIQDNLLSRDSQWTPAIMLLGQSYEKMEDYENARSCYERIRNWKHNEHCLIRIGACFINMQQYQDAINTYQSIPDLSYKKQVIISLAFCHEKNNDFEKALHLYKAHEKWKFDPQFTLAHAMCYNTMGDYQSAIEHLKTIKNWAKNGQILLALARTEDKQANYIEAVQFYKQAIEAGEETEATLSLAFCYGRMNKFQLAIATFLKVPDLYHNKVAYLGLAYQHLHNKEHADAQRCLEDITKKWPHYHDAQLCLIQLYDYTKSQEEAWTFFLDLIGKFPTSKVILVKACAHAIKIMPEKAQEILTLAKVHYPFLDSLLLLEAELSFKLKQPENGYVQLCALKKHYPRYIPVYIRLMIYHIQQNELEALKELIDECKVLFAGHLKFFSTITHLITSTDLIQFYSEMGGKFDETSIYRTNINEETKALFEKMASVKGKMYIVGSAVHNIMKQTPLAPTQDIDCVMFPARGKNIGADLINMGFSQFGLIPTLYQCVEPIYNRKIDCMVLSSTEGGLSIADQAYTQIETCSNENISENEMNAYDLLEHNSSTRDFTIGSVFLDADGYVYDPTERGIADQENKILRTIQHSTYSLREDPVRVLRAMKYMAKGYALAQQLHEALLNYTTPLQIVLTSVDMHNGFLPPKLDQYKRKHLNAFMRNLLKLDTSERDQIITAMRNYNLFEKLFFINFCPSVSASEVAIELNTFLMKQNNFLREMNRNCVSQNIHSFMPRVERKKSKSKKQAVSAALPETIPAGRALSLSEIRTQYVTCQTYADYLDLRNNKPQAVCFDTYQDYEQHLRELIDDIKAVLKQSYQLELHIMLADCYFNLDDYQSAADEYVKVISNTTIDKKTLLQKYILSLCHLGNYEQAIEVCINQAPTSPCPRDTTEPEAEIEEMVLFCLALDEKLKGKILKKLGDAIIRSNKDGRDSSMLAGYESQINLCRTEERSNVFVDTFASIHSFSCIPIIGVPLKSFILGAFGKLARVTYSVNVDFALLYAEILYTYGDVTESMKRTTYYINNRTQQQKMYATQTRAERYMDVGLFEKALTDFSTIVDHAQYIMGYDPSNCLESVSCSLEKIAILSASNPQRQQSIRDMLKKIPISKAQATYNRFDSIIKQQQEQELCDHIAQSEQRLAILSRPKDNSTLLYKVLLCKKIAFLARERNDQEKADCFELQATAHYQCASKIDSAWYNEHAASAFGPLSHEVALKGADKRAECGKKQHTAGVRSAAGGGRLFDRHQEETSGNSGRGQKKPGDSGRGQKKPGHRSISPTW